ncbi:McrB family protein [Streptomyces sp. NPDC088557]|uniref:McrB family protein n=1 Tax=Streptomyces sp. NPDC088557 TaxID=3365867 RepID=UPI003805EFC0
MAEDRDFRSGLAENIAAFDGRVAARSAARAEEERLQVLREFPLDDWPDMPLGRYALGPDHYQDSRYTYCRLLEYGTDAFGSIRGGSAAKHIVYQHRTREWRIVPGHLAGLPVREAWRHVRAEFTTAFAVAAEGDFDRIDELDALSYGQALTTKSLAVYFPDHFLPIFSSSHVRHFTRLLGGRTDQRSSGVRTWRANRELLRLVRMTPEFDGWRPNEVMRFLYAFHAPRPANRTIWKISPGERASLWEECLRGRTIRIAWDETGSLGQYESDRELKEALDRFWPHSAGGNLRLARQMLAYRDLEPGDLIVANRGKSEVLAVGTVAEGYTYDERARSHRHTVGVDWDTSYAQVFDSPSHAWQQTLARVPAALWREIRQGRTALPDEAHRPETAATKFGPPETGSPGTAGDTAAGDTAAGELPSWAADHLQGPRTADLDEGLQRLRERLLDMPATEAELPDAVRTVRDLLTHKGQVVLQGPPGTGKTRLALSVALALAGLGDRIEAPPEVRAAALAALSEVPEGTEAARLTMVTFHPSYGYEHFVEGFRPHPTADGAGLNLQLTDGVFRRICEEAANAPDDVFLLVIDEINRGDLPRILGELITLLELDKRGSVSVTLPTSGRPQTVPPNVRIIGTMNSADRSVGHLDAAIRRRFAFLDVPPDLDALDGEVEGLGLAEFLEGLNAKLDDAFGPDHLLGQAYLLAGDRPIVTAEQLSNAFHHEIVPLVSDYCLGRPELLRDVLGSLVDDRTGRVVQANPQDLPGMLADEFVASRAGEEELLTEDLRTEELPRARRSWAEG